jgi:hypothetical protein
LTKLCFFALLSQIPFENGSVDMDAMRLSRIALQAVATVFGALGILCLWFSFLAPRIALHAVVCLGTAAVITISLGYNPDGR